MASALLVLAVLGVGWIIHRVNQRHSAWYHHTNDEEEDDHER